jgi:hypothetical protein
LTIDRHNGFVGHRPPRVGVNHALQRRPEIVLELLDGSKLLVEAEIAGKTFQLRRVTPCLLVEAGNIGQLQGAGGFVVGKIEKDRAHPVGIAFQRQAFDQQRRCHGRENRHRLADALKGRKRRRAAEDSNEDEASQRNRQLRASVKAAAGCPILCPRSASSGESRAELRFSLYMPSIDLLRLAVPERAHEAAH